MLTFGGVLALSMVMFTGCASAGVSTPTPSASPTRAAAAVAPTAPSTAQAVTPAAEASIVIGGTSVSITDAEGSPVADVAYEGPADGVVASLTALLGQPTTTVHQNEKCISDSVDSAWGGLILNYTGTQSGNPVAFTLSVTGNVPGAVVETTHGARVGEPWPDYFAGVADHPMTTGEFSGKTFVELIDDQFTPWGQDAGIIVRTDDSSTISSIFGPTTLDHDC
ncbi:exported protein of unknown function [Agreia sp. COWG]|nr:exported protein of unknown function [Agreia sp. COWG]